LIIKTLQVENLRNLVTVQISPDPELNVIHGANGAGKTSVLESIVVLSRGRSFRTTQAGELIGPTQPVFRVFAETEDNQQNTQRLGLERSGKRWRGRKNGQDLLQLSQLTRSLPLVLMEPDSHLLISGPPEIRRKYLDWGMFHVEHGFLEVWRRYSKALKQRNAALRKHQVDVLDSLDDVLATLGSRLSAMRRTHSEKIAEDILPLLKSLAPELVDIRLEYQDGWSAESYKEALKAGRERDLDRGVTNSGPHRADLLMFRDRVSARAVLSRGEQKMLAVALLLTQARILADLGEPPLILLDDLASEFDQKHFHSALAHAQHIGGQVWITGTRYPELDGRHKVFHVERGLVQEVL
jgi:DNA replication and repair protein RecF